MWNAGSRADMATAASCPTCATDDATCANCNGYGAMNAVWTTIEPPTTTTPTTPCVLDTWEAGYKCNVKTGTHQYFYGHHGYDQTTGPAACLAKCHAECFGSDSCDCAQYELEGGVHYRCQCGQTKVASTSNLQFALTLCS